QLEVRGPSGKLSSGLEAAAVVFDLARVSGPGRQTFTITGDHVGLPAGVFFSRAVPAQVRLEFDRRIEKEALVLVRVSTPPAAGYEIVRMESSPAALRIVGPASRLESIKSVQTDPIPLDEVQGVREFVVQAFAGDPYVRFERPPEVRVRVEVALKGVRKQP
ncbi:MAG: CdaR family protein, partial [Bryobacteraceae bacterium]